MSDDRAGELPLDPPDAGQPADSEQHSAVDTQRAAKLRRGKKDEAREAVQFWHEVFSSPVGRREMWKILNELHPFDTKLANSPVGFPDERGTWMHLGRQITGQRLHQLWYAQFPALVLQMQQENDPNFPKPVKP